METKIDAECNKIINELIKYIWDNEDEECEFIFAPHFTFTNIGHCIKRFFKGIGEKECKRKTILKKKADYQLKSKK